MSIMNHLNHIISEHDYDYEYVPFNIYCANDVCYFYCFYDYETEHYLSILETTIDGYEEYRIINKESIISIDLVYELGNKSREKRADDIMYE